jgi:hypothetical protein
MKILYPLILAFALLLPLGSCDFLDIVPDNVATIDYAFTNRANAERYLYTCYSYRPKTGDIDWDPAMGGADETWQRIPQASTFRTLYTSYLARGEQNVNDPYFNFWDGVGSSANSINNLWIAIRDCNIFLENIDQVLIDMTDRDRTRWTSEAKFLKAYYHFYLLRAYGPVPIMDKNLPVSASVDEVKVWREPVDDVVEYIIALLEEAVSGLPDAGDVSTGTEAGRVDKLVARTLIADVRLWAASPLVNGNSDYSGIVDGRGKHLFSASPDNNKWAIAAKACEDAITICHEQGKSLFRGIDPLTLNAPPVFQLQTTYRQVICERWNSELIWGCTHNNHSALTQYATARLVRFDPAHLNDCLSEWAPTMKIVERYYSANGVPIDEDREWTERNRWYENRYKVRSEASRDDEKYFVRENEKTAYLHFNREPRFYASIGFDKGIYFGNGYYNFPDNVKYCDFFNTRVSGFQGGSGYSITGYAAKKMHSFKNAHTTNSTSAEYFPFPVYRLADLYLMYAEAVNEAEGPNGPSSEKMFGYIDAVRDRAGLSGVRESWSKYSSNPDKPDSREGLREIIQRERTIELAFEGKRFWDLRRWKKITELNEQPMGWNIQGENEEDFYNVVNVYPRNVSFSTKDYFFPIREDNLNVNEHLIQNYGW